MINKHICKVNHWLCLCLGMFMLAAGCVGPKEKVVAYPEPTPAPVSSEQQNAAPSKTLPQVMGNVPQQSALPEQKTQPQAETMMQPDMILSSLTLVDDRIIAYEGKLGAWDDLLQESGTMQLEEEQQQKITLCRQQVQEILAEYNMLHELLLDASASKGEAMTSPDRLAKVEREDIAYLESDCQLIVRSGQQSESWIAGTKGRLLEEREKEMAEALESGDFAHVVAVYEQFSEEDIQNVSSETVYRYAQALLRTGKAQQAVVVLQNLLGRIRNESSLQKEFEVMKLIADISFGLEDFSHAFEQYVDVINRYAGLSDNVEWSRQQQAVIASRSERGTEVKSFADLILAYLTFNPQNDGYKPAILASNFAESYPESPLNPTASRIYMESKDKADAWFAGILEQIGRFQTEKQYAEGVAFIEQLPRINLLPEKQDQLRMLSDELVSAQFEEAESQRMELEMELEQKWNTGLAHLSAKEYDEAIAVFNSLLDTTYDERARKKINESEQLAAEENRREAAELFVRANRSRELETKIDLLFNSRALLQEIIEKYPQSDLIDKVKRNMARIDEEITAINPSLLDSTASGNLPGNSEAVPDMSPFESPSSDSENAPGSEPAGNE